jgi:hypothetical protein
MIFIEQSCTFDILILAFKGVLKHFTGENLYKLEFDDVNPF